MRDTQSAEKEYARYPRYTSNSLYNPYRQMIKKPNQSKKSEADIIEQFYSSQMLQLYQKNQKSYPNPLKIIEGLKQKDKKLLELERSLHECQQKLRESQKTIKFQNKIEGSLRSPSLKGQEEIYWKKIQDDSFKIKLKFIPLFQQYLGNSKQFIKFADTENEKAYNLIFEYVERIIKNLKAQIVAAEEKATQRTLKKLQISEQKMQKQLSDQIQSNKRLNERINNYVEQCKTLNEERRKLDKQNNQLHAQIVNIHQTVVERSKVIESLRQELQAKARKCDESERNYTQQKKKYNIAQNSIKMLQQSVQSVEQKNKEQNLVIQQLQNDISQYQKKIEQDLNRNLNRVRSEENILSIKVMSETSEKLETPNRGLSKKQSEMEKDDDINIRARPKVEKMIYQWRQKLQKIVDEHARETSHRDQLIKALQDENKQLKLEIDTRWRMDQSSR